MKQEELEQYKSLFIKLRLFASKAAFNAEALGETIRILEKMKIQTPNDKTEQIMTAAVDTCSMLYQAKDYAALSAFADAVHTLPEVFMPPFIPKRHYWQTFVRPYFKKFDKNEFFKYKRYFQGLSWIKHK